MTEALGAGYRKIPYSKILEVGVKVSHLEGSSNRAVDSIALVPALRMVECLCNRFILSGVALFTLCSLPGAAFAQYKPVVISAPIVDATDDNNVSMMSGKAQYDLPAVKLLGIAALCSSVLSCSAMKYVNNCKDMKPKYKSADEMMAGAKIVKNANFEDVEYFKSCYSETNSRKSLGEIEFYQEVEIDGESYYIFLVKDSTDIKLVFNRGSFGVRYYQFSDM